MGQGYGKLLPYLDAGPENTEDKLKKAYKRIITTLEVPVKSSIVWKQLVLDPRNDHKTMSSLQEAVNFIHAGRVQKQNTLIITGQADQDQIVFATAYFMVLSGLPPHYADFAVSNAVKDLGWKLNKPYMNALKLFRQKPAKQLRQEMFKAGGEYSFSLLCEDVYRIYELAEISKPTDSQVKLDGPLSVNEDEGTFGSPAGAAVTPTSPKGNGQSVQKTPSSNSKAAVSAELLNMARSAPPHIPDVDDSAEHISTDTLEDLMQIRSSVGEVIEAEPVSFIPEIKPVDETHKLVETPAPETVTITNKVGAGQPSEMIPGPQKGIMQEATAPRTIANGLSTAEQKGDVLLKISSSAFEVNSVENTSYVGDLDYQASHKTEHSMVMNGAATPAIAETKRTKRKVNIIRSPKSSEVDLAKRVDAYLASTTEEERKKNRKHVVIIRANPQASMA
ncbi:hypothetical protein X801_07105 [Opisthorchis viverrini]|uniref:Uncharacterized protein n=1 Tax=Opisthorchis viverrini TaxID=6198 RepID=A0A1S8WRW1_OPIVI|nr:hypothetical protein X801_07105 [Opisthorchis viverrini]